MGLRAVCRAKVRVPNGFLERSVSMIAFLISITARPGPPEMADLAITFGAFVGSGAWVGDTTDLAATAGSAAGAAVGWAAPPHAMAKTKAGN